MQEECPRIVESQWPRKGKIPYLDTFHAVNCKKKEKKRKEKKSKEKKKKKEWYQSELYPGFLHTSKRERALRQ